MASIFGDKIRFVPKAENARHGRHPGDDFNIFETAQKRDTHMTNAAYYDIEGEKDMALTNEYLKGVYDGLAERYSYQPEYLQAVFEVLESLQPLIEKDDRYQKNAIIERIVEPERLVQFKVAWEDDNGNIQVNRGYRVQFNSAIGPYKGGLRVHPSVNASIL